MHSHPRGQIVQLSQEDHGDHLLTEVCTFDSHSGDHVALWDADCVLCDASIATRLHHDEAAAAATEHVCEPAT